MTNNKTLKLVLCIFISASVSCIYGQSALDINYFSTGDDPTAVLSDSGKNNLTRLFFRNDETVNEFRITTRAFTSDVADNLFNLSYYDGSSPFTFFKYSADSEQIALNANTVISNNSSNTNPSLLIEEAIDNNFTRLHFRNVNNASDKFSVAANLGTTAANSIGFYYNSSPRLLFNEDDSKLTTFGNSEIQSESSMTNPSLLLLETLDNNPSRIFFKNENNSSDQWSIAAQNGNSSSHLMGFYYNSTPRVVYYENVSELDITGSLDISDALNTSGNATFESNVLFENFYQLEPQSSAPTCGIAGLQNGRVYFDDTLKKLRVCVDGSWDSLN